MEIYGEISMEIDVLILHGIPWRNSMEVFHTGANWPKIQNFVKNYISHFRSNKMPFCN